MVKNMSKMAKISFTPLYSFHKTFATRMCREFQLDFELPMFSALQIILLHVLRFLLFLLAQQENRLKSIRFLNNFQNKILNLFYFFGRWD